MFPKTEGPRTLSSLRRFCGPSSALPMPTRETGGAVVSPRTQRHGVATLGHGCHAPFPQYTCRGSQHPERAPCHGTVSLAASSPLATGRSSQHGRVGWGGPRTLKGTHSSAWLLLATLTVPRSPLTPKPTPLAFWVKPPAAGGPAPALHTRPQACSLRTALSRTRSCVQSVGTGCSLPGCHPPPARDSDTAQRPEFGVSMNGMPPYLETHE